MSLRFTLRQLEYFRAVGEEGTIMRASQKINISSPSISTAISQLEAEFGVQIFVRHHAKGLSLTPGGQKLFAEAKLILDHAAALNDIANDIGTSVRGPIAIGVLSTAAPLLSATIRCSFGEEFPDVTITLKEGNQIELLRMLGNTDIDVALTYDLELPKDIEFEQFASLPLYVMLSERHRLANRSDISLHDLADEPMILLDIPLSRDYFLSCFHLADIQPNIVERTPQLSVVRSLVANEIGFSLINIKPQTNIAPDGEPLAFIPLSDNVRAMILCAVTKQTEHRSKIVEEFIQHVHRRVALNNLPGIV